MIRMRECLPQVTNIHRLITKHIATGSPEREADQYVLGILGQYYLEEDELRENHLPETMR